GGEGGRLGGRGGVGDLVPTTERPTEPEREQTGGASRGMCRHLRHRVLLCGRPGYQRCATEVEACPVPPDPRGLPRGSARHARRSVLALPLTGAPGRGVVLR